MERRRREHNQPPTAVSSLTHLSVKSVDERREKMKKTAVKRRVAKRDEMKTEHK